MRVLVLIAKAPLPAFAKTRLAGAGGLGVSGVVRLAQAFLEDTLRAVGGVTDIELQISYAPPESRALFAALAPGARLEPQGEGDLGARLAAALDAAFARGASRAVMIGTDTPHIGAGRIERAFELLAQADCVLGPASDGGYYLIGLGAPRPSLFEGVEWSSERVFEQTCARARGAGLRTALLEELFDVDRPADLVRLQALLDASGEPCPHTARVLAAEAGMAGPAAP